MLSFNILKEIRCEYCKQYEHAEEYEDADLSNPDSLFSPIYCPNCGEGFMAMGVTPRIHLQ